jgi:predicted nucleic acid-binding protein
MEKYVIDTQSLIKFLNGQRVINDKINEILRKADEGKNIIIIPSVVLFEIGYLYEL